MRAGSAIASSGRHAFGIGLQALLIAAIVAALAFAAATLSGSAPGGAKSVFAGKRTSTTPWIALTAASAKAAATAPSLGSSIAFATGYPSNTKNPRIEVLCYQGGALVYGEAGGVSDTFLLGGAGSTWLSNGGSAACKANLFYFAWRARTQTYNLLASTSFAAN